MANALTHWTFLDPQRQWYILSICLLRSKCKSLWGCYHDNMPLETENMIWCLKEVESYFSLPLINPGEWNCCYIMSPGFSIFLLYLSQLQTIWYHIWVQGKKMKGNFFLLLSFYFGVRGRKWHIFRRLYFRPHYLEIGHRPMADQYNQRTGKDHLV